jgi:BolA protein
MLLVAEQIHALLTDAFSPQFLEVADDSAKHAGHAGARPGGQTHFTVRIVSSQFAGMSRVARHRAVYAPLQPLFDTGLHALAIEAKAPEEM